MVCGLASHSAELISIWLKTFPLQNSMLFGPVCDLYSPTNCIQVLSGTQQAQLVEPSAKQREREIVMVEWNHRKT